MKKLNTLFLVSLILSQIGCSSEKNAGDAKFLHFATSGEYPPFEYKHKGVLRGFDIELAKLIAKELGKEAVFEDMQFANILPALTSGQVDAAISTITITKERKNNFDFTQPYYFEGMAAVFRMNESIQEPAQFVGKILSAQLGSTMEIWLKKHAVAEKIVAMDNNNQAIEALKAGHVDVVLMDGVQGAMFSKKNPDLSYSLIAKAEDGYGIALPKNSPMTVKMNQAIESLKEKGVIQKLKHLWLEEDSWTN